MSATSSCQIPSRNALPARLWPSGPGSMSGKSVSTFACHTSVTLPALAPRLGGALLDQTVRRIDADTALPQIHLADRGAREGHHHRLAVATRDLHRAAGPVVMKP